MFFTFSNSVDLDEMQHNAAFYLGLHSLQKCSFRGFPNTKGYWVNIKYWVSADNTYIFTCKILLIIGML